MAVPTYRSEGAFNVSNNSSALSLVAGTIQDGDLIVISAIKDASSNFTFPAGFTKAVEVCTLAIAAAIGWKWGLASDSGDTFVSSVAGGGGASNIFFGNIDVYAGVESTATPLKGLQSRVDSKNWIATPSLQTTAPNELVVAHLLQSDNIAASSASFADGGWTVENSYGTSTGNDGQALHLVRTVATSGTYINPNSSALGTAHNWISFAFALKGPDWTVTSYTATDTFASVDSYSELLSWLRVAGDATALVLSDNRQANRTKLSADAFALVDPRPSLYFTATANDVLALLDSAVSSVSVAGAGPVVKLEGDALVLSDAYLSLRLSTRRLSDVLAVADADQLRRLCTVLSTEGQTVDDNTMRYALRGRVTADGVVVVDTGPRTHLFETFATDTVNLSDAASLRRALYRLANDALAAGDSAFTTQAARIVIQTLTDTAALTDAADLRRVLYRQALDALFALDEATALKVTSAIVMSASDGVALTDVALRSYAWTRRAGDAFDATDAASLFRVLLRLVADGATAHDSAISSAARRISQTVSDGANLTDAVALRRLLWRAAGDVLLTMDAASGYRLLGALVTDGALTLSDAALRARALTRRADDALNPTDSASLLRYLFRVVADGVALGDSAISSAARRITQLVSDGASLTDSASLRRVLWRAAEDQLLTTDAATRYRLLQLLVADGAITLTDAALRVRRLTRRADDNFNATDSASLFRLLLRLVSDGAATTDQALSSAARRITLLLDDGAIVTDAVALRRLLWRAASEYLAVSESLTAYKLRNAVVADAVATVDGQLLQRQLTRRFSEQFGVTDGALRAMQLTRTLTEAVELIGSALPLTTGMQIRVAGDDVTLSDGAIKVRMTRKQISDGFDLSDETRRVMRLVRRIADGFALSDADYIALKLTKAVYTRTQSDPVTVQDVYSLARIRSPALLDLILALNDAAWFHRAFGRSPPDALNLTDSAAMDLRRLLVAVEDLLIEDGVALARLRSRNLAELLELDDEDLAVYIPDASLRYVVRVLLSAEQLVELGAESLMVIGADPLPIELGGIQ